MARLGADVQQLDALARSFDTHAASLATSRAGLTNLVNAVEWDGPDALAFRTRWRSGDDRLLQRIVEQLTGHAAGLRRQADQQRRTSEFAFTGGGGGGGGAWSPSGWFSAPFENETYSGETYRHGETSTTTENGTITRTAEGEIAVGAGVVGSSTVEGPLGSKSETEWKAQAGAGLEGEGEVSMGAGGIRGKGEGEAWAGLRGEVANSSEIGHGLLKNEFDVNALVGGRAGAEGEFEMGWRSIGAEGKVEAFAGAEIEMKNRSTALWGAIGGELGGDVHLTADRVGFEADIGAALGVGFDVSIDASFSPSGLVHDGLDAGGAAVSKVHDWVGWP